jgi:hypothetical protein
LVSFGAAKNHCAFHPGAQPWSTPSRPSLPLTLTRNYRRVLGTTLQGDSSSCDIAVTLDFEGEKASVACARDFEVRLRQINIHKRAP